MIYELHIGTFTPSGTFIEAATKLPTLAALGVNVIEVMPIAAFAGTRNWGYDGVALYAPAACYGTPDDFRDFVSAAHANGLAVVLDVVYNHVGPEGAYHGQYAQTFMRTGGDWGGTIDFQDPDGAKVRSFCIDNALHWLHEYHLDGLRLDAAMRFMTAVRVPSCESYATRFARTHRDRSCSSRKMIATTLICCTGSRTAALGSTLSGRTIFITRCAA